MLDFTSQLFEKELIPIADRTEAIVRGGRHLFPLLPAAFEGVRQIGVIGWGPQGAAQAQNLRDSLAGSDIRVTVGLRDQSPSLAEARAAGFVEAEGTLGSMDQVLEESDMVLLLISDAAQAQHHDDIFGRLRPGTTLGLSHGFLLGHLDNVGASFPEDIDVVAVCPKGMGKSVRALYEQGSAVNGAGINASFAVHQDVTGKATDRALGWAVGLGAPYTFRTTLRSELVSDISGERAILLGAVHGIVECLYRSSRAEGVDAEQAFERSAESITGPISRIISKQGLLGVYKELDAAGQQTFAKAYAAAYPAGLEVFAEIYDEVASGNELRSIIMASERLDRFPLGNVEQGEMWEAGRTVRARRRSGDTQLDPTTAGIYCGVMMGQVDQLIAHGHPYSEVANESVIECVDSLNPYMHAHGVAYMIDNCSITARLGARKWAPRFDYLLEQITLPLLREPERLDMSPFEDFGSHVVHDVLRTCAELRPSVDVYVE
ncbi:MAG: ketol-acid reductoisomerase [Actinobacteria bacterium]|nr:ketol-acid reductoisomerase [Actinomycetota bacterium]